MKKVLLLLGSIVLFLISLFFLIGVIALRDIDAIIIFGMPSLCFGMLCYFTFKKYLKLINFCAKDFYEKWKNSKFLRNVDLVLSCLSYIFVVVGLSTPNSLLVISIISTLIFGALYIIKPLLDNKIDFYILKNNLLKITIGVILFVAITILCNYYFELRLIGGISDLTLEFLKVFDSGIEKIVFLIFYGIYKLIVRQGLIILLAILIYLYLISYIYGCLKPSINIEKKLKILNVFELGLCLIIIVIHCNVIIKSLWSILLNVFIVIMLIANIVIKHKAISKSNNVLL